MPGILDQVGLKPTKSSFRPTTVRQLFVLRLAQKLGEPTAVEHYAELARLHSDKTLLLAYRRTFNHGHPPRDLARQFHAELAAANEQDYEAPTEKLLAIKIERRCLAVAVFIGTELDYHDIRHLSSQPDKAAASVMNFLGWVIGNFEIGSAALERMTNGDEIRRAALNRTVLDALRGNVIPVWEIGKRQLLEAYALPPLLSRKDLRRAAHGILWSLFNTASPHCQEIDAAALGLYVQTERQFYQP